MKLTDNIVNSKISHDISSDDFKGFREGAEFARDFYENQKCGTCKQSGGCDIEDYLKEDIKSKNPSCSGWKEKEERQSISPKISHGSLEKSMKCAFCKTEFTDEDETSHITMINGYVDEPKSGVYSVDITICRSCGLELKNDILKACYNDKYIKLRILK